MRQPVNRGLRYKNPHVHFKCRKGCNRLFKTNAARQRHENKSKIHNHVDAVNKEIKAELAYAGTEHQVEIAKRNPTNLRYDILDPTFLEVMAAIADYGAKVYGEFNWHKSRLTGNKGPVNHIMKHLMQYQLSIEYDHPEIEVSSKAGAGVAERRMHLAAIAFNAMMEWYYETNRMSEKNS